MADKGICSLRVGLLHMLAGGVYAWRASSCASPPLEQSRSKVVSVISESHILKAIEFLSASPRNSRESPEDHIRAGNWIAKEFEQLGLTVDRQEFEIPDQSPARSGTNIVGTLNPLSTKKSLLIGAHYDTVPGSPGADDNASGVAAMLECARLLVESGSDRKVTFVAFDAEEIQPPVEGLHGSTAYISNLPESQHPSSAIILETIGFSSAEIKQQLPGSFRFLFRRAFKALRSQNFEANSLLVLSKRDSRQLSRTLEQTAAQPEIKLPILPLEVPWWMPLVRNLRRSDHAPFWAANVPAVMISDTANFRNPHYHQPTDTAETIDVKLIVKLVKTIVDAIKFNAI